MSIWKESKFAAKQWERCFAWKTVTVGSDSDCVTKARWVWVERRKADSCDDPMSYEYRLPQGNVGGNYAPADDVIAVGALAAAIIKEQEVASKKLQDAWEITKATKAAQGVGQYDPPVIDREYDIPVVDALHALESLRDRVAGLEAAIKAALPLETFWLDYGRAKIAADAKPLSSVME